MSRLRDIQNIQLGAFTLLEPLGKGGMGEVWFGVHTKQRTAVAVKIISADYAAEPAFVEAFGAEVQAVARLNHPGVVMVFDYGTISLEAEEQSGGALHAGNPYLVMEVASGGSLQDRPLPTDWPTLRDILLELLEALGHAHARGVIHRDVKPGNVLVCLDTDLRPGIKLTDYGLAAAGERLRAEKLTGTPAFMAPEQCDGRWRDHGPWTDLYGFGCLAYALASGKLPFDDTNPMQVVLHQFAMDPPPLTAHLPVPDGFESWIRKLMAKRPEDRFRWAADAAHALIELGEPVDPGGESGEQELADRAPMALDWRPRERHATTRTSAMEMVGAGLGLYGLRTIPLVGREDERDDVWAALSEVELMGEARVVLLRGEAGTGKSRLAEWLSQRGHEAGASSYMRAAHSATVAGPAEGFPRMFISALRCVGLRRNEVHKRISSLLRGRSVNEESEADVFTELLIPASPDDVAGGARVIDFSGPEERYTAARRLLDVLVEKRPIIVHVDDAQWALDALGLVQHVLEANDLHPVPVLFLLTVRSDLLPERPLAAEALEVIAASPHTRSVDIGPLPADDRASLITELLGLEGALADEVVDRTAGNPLFAVQLVGDWVQRGVLEVGTTGFKLVSGETAEIPDDIHVLWSTRIRRVFDQIPHGQQALELAAALGVDVSARELAVACAKAGVQNPDELATALLAQGLAQRTADGFAFAHGMLRESLERTAREVGRWTSHNFACAAMIEEIYPAHQRGRSERVGRHLVEAGDLRRAVDLLLEAAQERTETSDYRIALALLVKREQCLTNLGLGTDSPLWAHGWVATSNNLRLLGDLEDAAGYAARAESSARLEEDQFLLAEAFRAQAHVAKEKGDYGAALKRYRLAHDLYEALERKIEVSNCLWGMGTTVQVIGDIDQARTYLEQSLEIAEAEGETRVSADARHMLAGIALKAGRMDDALTYVEGAYAGYDALGNRIGLGNSLNGLGEIHRFRGNFSVAEEKYREALVILDSLGSPTTRIARVNLSLVLLQTGDYDEARRNLEEVRRELERMEARVLKAVVYTILLPCTAAQQDWAGFVRYYDAGAELLSQTGMVDPDLAQSAELAGDLAEQAEQPDIGRLALQLALEQWVALGERERARQLAERLGQHLTSADFDVVE